MKQPCSCEPEKKGNNLFCDLTIGEDADAVIPAIDTRITARDVLGAFIVRMGFNRSRYRVKPGLYAVGNPDEKSPVFASANYKLSFDKLRSSLTGINAYILVLDTKGINVWCAAGKGTFGTDELVSRILASGLGKIVSHRKIVLPQLGAPGVKAHEVLKRCGFYVLYGPVRAKDIPRYIENGYKASESMRRVFFGISDRFVLTGTELTQSFRYLVFALPLVIGLGFLKERSFDLNVFLAILPFCGAVFIGAFAVPVLLPWIPGKPFALKGWLAGLAFAISLSLFSGEDLPGWLFNLLLFPALTAFVSLNFTGASTFTSLSGVKKEMKVSIPLIILSLSAGVVFRIIGFFFNGGNA